MRSLTIKTVCNMSGNLPTTYVAPPKSPLGDNEDKSIQIRKVVNIPDDVKDFQVVRLFGLTTDLSWLNGRTPRLEFDYAELGEGKIIRE
jgi:hypothetical protein